MNKTEQELIREVATMHSMSNKDVVKAMEALKGAFEVLADAIINAFQHLFKEIKEIVEVVSNAEKRLKHDYNWHVPKNIIMNHQVLERMPMVPHMRERR